MKPIIDPTAAVASCVVIGENVVVMPNAVIGVDGYSWQYSVADGRLCNTPHEKNVVLKDYVTIHPFVHIARGSHRDTVIGRSSKINATAHIGHNVIIGKNVRVGINVCICGSAEIGDGCYIAPGTVIRDHVKIGKSCIIGLGSVVVEDVPEKSVVMGVPARVIRKVENTVHDVALFGGER